MRQGQFGSSLSLEKIYSLRSLILVVLVSNSSTARVEEKTLLITPPACHIVPDLTRSSRCHGFTTNSEHQATVGRHS